MQIGFIYNKYHSSSLVSLFPSTTEEQKRQKSPSVHSKSIMSPSSPPPSLSPEVTTPFMSAIFCKKAWH